MTDYRRPGRARHRKVDAPAEPGRAAVGGAPSGGSPSSPASSPGSPPASPTAFAGAGFVPPKGRNRRHSRSLAFLPGYGGNTLHIKGFKPVVARSKAQQPLGLFSAAFVCDDYDGRKIGVFRAHGKQVFNPKTG